LPTPHDALPDFISNKASRAKSTSSKANPSKQGIVTSVFAVEDNHLARELFGQYDEHLAVLERELQVEAVSRGNQVTLQGSDVATAQAKQVLEILHQRLEAAETISVGDVEGAIRHCASQDATTSLPTQASGKTTKKSGTKSGKDSFAKTGAGKPQASISTAKKTVHARTPTQDAYIRAMEKSELVFGTGPAGTGKTYLAVAYAASLLERGAVDRIILSRPAVEAGERLGFLPGDMKEKVDPYLRPLYDALYDMMPGEKVERAITSGVIEIAPLAFMRGRTLAHSAVILDEAQNTTSMQMKMFLTRLGEGSKMMVNGDPSQIDLPHGQTSGLVEALELLEPVKGVDMVHFTSADVVRHKLVARIVEAYDDAGRANAAQNRT